MSNVLEVRDLAKSFGGIKAVSDVSFDLERGSMLAMIGPNGAGKSTCFNLINGQLKPDRGSVTILGKKTNSSKPRDVWKLGVGRTFQIAATFGSMTVLENVQMAKLSYHKKTKSLLKSLPKMDHGEAMDLLKLVGLEDQHDRACGVLAYGDVKRLELAIALANHPKLLLMDEPAAGMGTAEREGLMALTSEIVQTQGIGVLFTEHDMDAVFGHADSIIVLNRGELVAEGTPDAVRTNTRVQEIYLGEEPV
jgi:branched-chain amino acid transport system ATP-binding protein